MDLGSANRNLRTLLDEGPGVPFVPDEPANESLAEIFQETDVLEALLTGLISTQAASSRDRRLVQEQFEIVERALGGRAETLEIERIRLYVAHLRAGYLEYVQAFEA
jgi:hypothetical protein